MSRPFVDFAEQLSTLGSAEHSYYSQNGEDGVIVALADRVGCAPTMIEIGASSGIQCNGRWFRQNGWDVVGFDGNPEGSDWVRTAFVTAKNVNSVLAESELAPRVGVLSIDVDGNDLWILLRIAEEYLPAVLVMEYNASLGPVLPWTVAYRPKRNWDHSNYFGASLAALAIVADGRGYDLVFCERAGVNAFFVRRDLMAAAGLLKVPVVVAYRPPAYGRIDALGGYAGHRPTNRHFVVIGSFRSAQRWYQAASHPFPINRLLLALRRLSQSDVRQLSPMWIRNAVRRVRGGGPTK
jgi:hypothetical protein